MIPLTLTQFVGLFNIFAGLMLTASLLLMGVACVMWVARLGTSPTHRDDALTLMQWAIAVLFTLIVLLFLVQYIQRHTATAMYVIGFLIIGVVIWGVVFAAKDLGGHEEVKE